MVNFSAHHVALSVKDMDISVDFYKNFGFKKYFEWESDDKQLKICHLKLGEVLFLELFAYSANSISNKLTTQVGNNLEVIGIKHLGLNVDDINEAIKHLVSKGLVDKKTEITKGRTGINYFFLMDPDGNWVEVVEDKRSLMEIK